MANKVGLIGHGAIGREIASALLGKKELGNETEKEPEKKRFTREKSSDKNFSELKLVGVFDPFASSIVPQKVASLEELCSRKPDIIIEAAGHDALVVFGAEILKKGIDLLVLSAGALGRKWGHEEKAESLMEEFQQVLGEKKSGRLLISTGAIGGLDILGAAKLAGKIASAEIISEKPARNLLVPELPKDVVAAIEAEIEKDKKGVSSTPITAFSGNVRDAIELFPQSANVCATVGFATLGLDETKVTLIADAKLDTVIHQINLIGAVGTYELKFSNRPSEKNEKTSAVVPFSVLRALKHWAAFRAGSKNLNDTSPIFI